MSCKSTNLTPISPSTIAPRTGDNEFDDKLQQLLTMGISEVCSVQ